jgi:hypothetical protein
LEKSGLLILTLGLGNVNAWGRDCGELHLWRDLAWRGWAENLMQEVKRAGRDAGGTGKDLTVGVGFTIVCGNYLDWAALAEGLMGASSARVERRRSPRVLIRIPIKVFSSDGLGHPIRAAAEAVTVSRFGALLWAPFEPGLGTVIEVFNGLNEEVKEFRVVRVAKSARDGVFELGVEMLQPLEGFWGIHFPNETSPRPA